MFFRKNGMYGIKILEPYLMNLQFRIFAVHDYNCPGSLGQLNVQWDDGDLTNFASW
jgi:hypothetical protein